MVIAKLLNPQIVTYWDYIKYAYVAANGLLGSAKIDSHNKDLLLSLLSNKYHCWLCLSDDRSEIYSVLITSIVISIDGSRSLYFECFYGYKHTTMEDKDLFLDAMKKFALAIKCSSIILNTKNPTIVDIVKDLNFYEPYKIFECKIGG